MAQLSYEEQRRLTREEERQAEEREKKRKKEYYAKNEKTAKNVAKIASLLLLFSIIGLFHSHMIQAVVTSAMFVVENPFWIVGILALLATLLALIVAHDIKIAMHEL